MSTAAAEAKLVANVLFATLELALLPKARFMSLPSIEFELEGGEVWSFESGRPELFAPTKARAPALTLIGSATGFFELFVGGAHGDVAERFDHRGDLQALSQLLEALSEPKSVVSVRLGKGKSK